MNFIPTLGKPLYPIKEIEKKWFFDRNFKFSKDKNPKFGPEVVNEICYYCSKYQFETRKKKD